MWKSHDIFDFHNKFIIMIYFYVIYQWVFVRITTWKYFLLLNVPLKQKNRIFCHRIMGLKNKATISERLKCGNVETNSEFSSLAKCLRVVRWRVCNSKKLEKPNFALMTPLSKGGVHIFWQLFWCKGEKKFQKYFWKWS